MSIVTIAVYRSVTGDTATASGTVQDWLDDVEQDLEEYLDRPLHFDGTERCRINNERRGNVVYPRATPIIDPGTLTVAGNALVGASPVDDPFTTSYPAYAEVTYEGGWTAATLPRAVRNDICWAVRQAVRGEAALVPIGAMSVSLGDASVSWATGADPDQRWSRQTRRYRRRRQ